MLMNRNGLVTVALMLNDHQDGLGEKFITNVLKPESIKYHGFKMKCKRIQDCVMDVLDWYCSNEGSEFWSDVYEELLILNTKL